MSTDMSRDHLPKPIPLPLEPPEPKPQQEVQPDPEKMPVELLPASTFKSNITFQQYKSETQLKALTDMIAEELSEPYSVFTYRAFVNNHPELCFLVYDGDKCIGGIMSKVDFGRHGRRRGYIGMLVVDTAYRGQRIGSQLVRLTMRSMYLQGIDICLLETECHNHVALSLYENLGFLRTKLLPRYYMNNADAYRLKFWLQPNGMVQQYVKQQEQEEKMALLKAQQAPASKVAPGKAQANTKKGGKK